jgi:5'-nucleotidase
MNKKTIAVDMDGVLADTAAQYRKWYERETGIQLPHSAFEGVSEDECLPDGTARRYLYVPGFFRTTPVVPGAQAALQQLMKDYEIYIVSAAMEFPQSLPEKLDWLAEHFPFITWHNVVFCGNKGIIGTHYMIDDHVKNLDRFSGKPLLFSAPHNIHVQHHQRLANWQEALNVMQAELSEPQRNNSL